MSRTPYKYNLRFSQIQEYTNYKFAITESMIDLI